MKEYIEKCFSDETEAKRFSRKVRGTVKFTQAMDETGKIDLVYLVRYTEPEKCRRNRGEKS